MAGPFTPGRVCRFLLLWLLVIAAVYGAFMLLAHVRGGQSIVPHSSQLSVPFRVPMQSSSSPKAA